MLNTNALLVIMIHAARDVSTDSLYRALQLAVIPHAAAKTCADQLYSVVMSQAAANMFMPACSCMRRHRQGLKGDNG